MTLTFQDDSISSDRTRHTARLAPGHERTWAAELGLSTPDALAWASEPSGQVSVAKDAVVPKDPEADGS